MTIPQNADVPGGAARWSRCRDRVAGERMKIPDRTGRCECDWAREHGGEPCRNESADHGEVRTSPELCMPCLFVCCAERDDAAEAAS